MASSWIPRARAAAVAAVLAALQGETALADDEGQRARARTLIAEASGLYAEGKHDRALEQLRAAYALYPSPTIHFNLGLTYQALARELEAAESFERFLAESDTNDAALASRREEARGYLVELEARMAAVEVVADVVAAEVSLDGRGVGRTPLARPIRVRPGSHRLVLQTPVAREELPFEVRAGERLRLVVRLGSATSGPPLLLAAAPRSQPEAVTPLYRRWWVWTAVAVVAAGALTVTALARREREPFCDCEAGVVRF